MNSEPEVKESVQTEQVQTEQVQTESSIEGIELEESVEVVGSLEEATNSDEEGSSELITSTEVIAKTEETASVEEAEVLAKTQEAPSAQVNTEAEIEASEEFAAQNKVTIKEKMQAFGQKISVGQVVALMVCILLLLMGTSFMIEAFRPVPEPEPETQETEEVEEPRVIRLSSISPDYIPVISEIYGEISAHTDYETMLSDLQCWVKEFGRINIREESNTDSRVIGYVVYGDQLSMYGTQGDFTKVKYTDHQTGEPAYGFCYSAFLSKEEPSSAKVYLNVPLYKQADPRWGSKMIGGYETLASAGCTTTCISMVESYVHGQNIYPNMMADQLPYTYDGLLTFPGRYSRYAGKDYLQVILNFLHSGMPVLVSGYTSDGRTHWVVVVGYNGDGIDMRPADFVINDPGANRSTLADFFRNYPLFEKIVYYTG